MKGHRIGRSLALVLASVLIASQAAGQVQRPGQGGQGQDGGQGQGGQTQQQLRLGLLSSLALPVAASSTTGTFQGTLNVQRFAARGSQIVAVALISGTAVAADGRVATFLNGPIEVPVTVKAATSALRPDDIIPAQAPQTCGVLHLEFGGIALDVLGLALTTSPVTLDLTGVTGGTNLLGTAVCGVLGALTSAVNVLVGLLNTLLGVLGGLTGGLTL